MRGRGTGRTQLLRAGVTEPPGHLVEAKLHITTPPMKCPARWERVGPPISFCHYLCRAVELFSKRSVKDWHMVRRRASGKHTSGLNVTNASRPELNLRCSQRCPYFGQPCGAFAPDASWSNADQPSANQSPSQSYQRKRGPRLSLRATCAANKTFAFRGSTLTHDITPSKIPASAHRSEIHARMCQTTCRGRHRPW